jgi:hypothetical protein
MPEINSGTRAQQELCLAMGILRHHDFQAV